MDEGIPTQGRMSRLAWCNELKKQWDAFRPPAPETLRELTRLPGGTPLPEN